MSDTPSLQWSFSRVALAPLRWVERARGRRRSLLVLLYFMVGSGIGMIVYRQARLVGLPNVGDPFDPTPLLTLRVADEKNAFVLYREARSLSHHDKAAELRLLNSPYAWPAPTDTEGLAYLERNEEALALWKRGSERPDALERPIGELSFDSLLPDIQEHRHFVRLACLHVSRCQSEGDLAGAWEWLRAILRGSRLVGRNGTIIARLVGTAEYGVAVNLARPWMADPNVGAHLLRQALRDVEEINALTAPVHEALQVEYLTVMKGLEGPEKIRGFFLNEPYSADVFDRAAWYNHLPAYHHARWFLNNEPECSRRLTRLAFSNWLAHSDDPSDERPALIGAQDKPVQARPGSPDAPRFFDVAPPAGPGPRALAARVERALLAPWLLPTQSAFLRTCDRERGLRAGLVMSLAQEVFRREHGRDAASSDELLGDVLGQFPDGHKPTEDTP